MPLTSSRMTELERLLARTRRAPCTRSGRTATTLPTASPVMAASPRPMSTCQPTIAVASVSSGIGRLPADGVQADEGQRGHRHRDERRDGGRRRDHRDPLGQHGLERRGRPASRTTRPTRPISVMLVPSAVMPAVGEQQALHEQDDASGRAVAVHGPTRTAASAPPSRWPLVPAPTGKFSIWAAKTKVATSPASGAVRSSSSRRAPRRASPTPTAATAAVAERRWGRRGSRRGRACAALL